MEHSASTIKGHIVKQSSALNRLVDVFPQQQKAINSKCYSVKHSKSTSFHLNVRVCLKTCEIRIAEFTTIATIAPIASIEITYYLFTTLAYTAHRQNNNTGIINTHASN